MGISDPIALARRARRVYEIGRLRLAAARAWPVAIVGLAALALCGSAWLAVEIGALLLALTIFFAWRGEEYGRAILPGIAAGGAPFVLPLVMQGCGPLCVGGTCFSVCIVASVMGGMVGGAALGIASLGRSRGRIRFLAAGGSLAIVTGALGRAIGGLVAFAGMAAEFLLATTPAILVAKPRRV